MYIFKNRTGLVDLQKHRIGDDSYQTYYITPTEELLEDLERQHERCAALNTMLRPMIVPPKPWTNTVEGGYCAILNKSTWLVRNRPPEGCQVGEAREMNQEPGTGIPDYIPADHAPEVYEAINTVQNTAWHINGKVCEVMEKVWKEGGGEKWKLPYREDRPSAQYEENFKNKSKRAGLDKKLQIAREYLDEPRIYFPHTFDFRGRMYPLPLFVNPIGDDTGRALLEQHTRSSAAVTTRIVLDIFHPLP